MLLLLLLLQLLLQQQQQNKNKASLAAGPAAAAAAAAPAAAAATAAAAGFHNVPLATPKHHATAGRNNLQKHAAPSGFSDCSCWACCCCCCCSCCWWCCWCLTLPSEQTRNQLQSAAPMPSKQLHGEVLAGDSETAKHHGPEGRNDLQKHAVPGLNVPSGFS